MPISFEPNVGQTAPGVSFMAHVQGAGIFFSPTSVTFNLGGRFVSSATGADTRAAAPQASEPQTQVARLSFLGSNASANISGGNLLPGQTNYFQGNDPTRWHTNVPTYAGVTYDSLYPGVDLAYSGAGGKLKGTYTVASGADPALIRWRYEGAESVHEDSAGNLQVRYAVSAGQSSSTLSEQAPLAWQVINGQRIYVQVSYMVDAAGTVAFALGSYDRTQPLVIDPTLDFSTYLGGIGDESAYGLAVGPSGDIYIAGYTSSSHTFPPMNPAMGVGKGYWDAFVTRMSSDGQTMIFSSFLAGTDWDVANGMTVDKAGNIYLGGETSSTDFPTVRPIQAKYGGGNYDAFVTEFSDKGEIVYSTYLGGSGLDRGHSIALDNQGNVLLAGYTGSTDFPVQAPLQQYGGGINDTFVTKLDIANNKLIYSTYLGGSGLDYGSFVTATPDGSAIVTGYTSSADFPLSHPVQGSYGGGAHDVFVTKLAPDGSDLIYSTFLGGSLEDVSDEVVTSAAGNVYLTGYTTSPNFPMVNAFQSQQKGSGSTAFVTELDASGSKIIYSTYFGRSPTSSVGDQGLALVIGPDASIYVAGSTNTTDLPLARPLQTSNGGKTDAFIARFNPSGSSLDFSTYLGGAGEDFPFAIALDQKGNIYIAGSTHSSNLPMVRSYQQDMFGSGDMFLAEISDTPDTVVTPGVERTPAAWPTYIYITDDDGNPYPDPPPAIGLPEWASTPWVVTPPPAVSSDDSDDDNDIDTTPGATEDTDSDAGTTPSANTASGDDTATPAVKSNIKDTATAASGVKPTFTPLVSPSALPIAAGTDTQGGQGQAQTIIWIVMGVVVVVGVAALFYFMRTPIAIPQSGKPVTGQAASRPSSARTSGRPAVRQVPSRPAGKRPPGSRPDGPRDR